MANQMEKALNEAGVFVATGALYARARREMNADLARRRKLAVRTLIEQGFSATRLSVADLEFAVRVMGARRRVDDDLVLPGFRGWDAAGRRKR